MSLVFFQFLGFVVLSWFSFVFVFLLCLFSFVLFWVCRGFWGLSVGLFVCWLFVVCLTLMCCFLLLLRLLRHMVFNAHLAQLNKYVLVTPYATQKDRLRQDFESFLAAYSACPPPLATAPSLLDAAPVDVVRFLRRRCRNGCARVHVFACACFGSSGLRDCGCPHRFAAGAVDSYIGQLRAVSDSIAHFSSSPCVFVSKRLCGFASSFPHRRPLDVGGVLCSAACFSSSPCVFVSMHLCGVVVFISASLGCHFGCLSISVSRRSIALSARLLTCTAELSFQAMVYLHDFVFVCVSCLVFLFFCFIPFWAVFSLSCRFVFLSFVFVVFSFTLLCRVFFFFYIVCFCCLFWLSLSLFAFLCVFSLFVRFSFRFVLFFVFFCVCFFLVCLRFHIAGLLFPPSVNLHIATLNRSPCAFALS